jgi:hypothetical protein
VGRKKGMSPQEISGINSSSLSFFVIGLRAREGEERKRAWKEQARNWEENLYKK